MSEAPTHSFRKDAFPDTTVGWVVYLTGFVCFIIGLGLFITSPFSEWISTGTRPASVDQAAWFFAISFILPYIFDVGDFRERSKMAAAKVLTIALFAVFIVALLRVIV
jgi:hypothetical protein